MSNPLLNDGEVFINQGTDSEMTVSGTITKSVVLWFFLAVGAAFSWMNPHITVNLLIPFVIVGFVLALIIVFKKSFAPFLSPVYALVEGLFLGAFSFLFETMYPGIVTSAFFWTIAVLICMLVTYKTGLLKASPRFVKVVCIATFAIALVYIINLGIIIFSGTGIGILSIQDSSPLAIGINLLVIAVAAFNLIIDFDIIEKGASTGAPKYMEWYGAFALMVTLIWLYIEILRLLARLRD